MSKPGANIPPNRMLHISLSGFHALPNVLVAGDVGFPFDTLHLYWLNSDLTLSEKKILDSEVFKTRTNKVQVKD